MKYLSTFSSATAKKKANKRPSFLGKLGIVGKGSVGGAASGAIGGAAYGGLLATRKGFSGKSIAPVFRGSIRGAVASGQEGAAIGTALGAWKALKTKSNDQVKKAKTSVKKMRKSKQRDSYA